MELTELNGVEFNGRKTVIKDTTSAIPRTYNEKSLKT